MFVDFVRTWGTEISIVIRVLGIITAVLFYLPLQIREAKVRNGLRLLRYELLAGGIVFMLINIPSLFSLIDLVKRFDRQPFTNSMLQLVNAIGYLFIVILLAVIYRQQFSEKQKGFHNQISDVEDGKSKVVPNT